MPSSRNETVAPECPTCECRRVVLGGYPPTPESMNRRDVAWCQICRVERPIREFLEVAPDA